MTYRSLYHVRKEREQLERKLARLTDREKIRQTCDKIQTLEAEETRRLAHWGGKR